jgi:hypothetical protein
MNANREEARAEVRRLIPVDPTQTIPIRDMVLLQMGSDFGNALSVSDSFAKNKLAIWAVPPKYADLIRRGMIAILSPTKSKTRRNGLTSPVRYIAQVVTDVHEMDPELANRVWQANNNTHPSTWTHFFLMRQVRDFTANPVDKNRMRPYTVRPVPTTQRGWPSWIVMGAVVPMHPNVMTEIEEFVQ